MALVYTIVALGFLLSSCLLKEKIGYVSLRSKIFIERKKSRRSLYVSLFVLYHVKVLHVKR